MSRTSNPLRYFLLLLLLVIFSPPAAAQPKFAWCPQEQIMYPKNGFLEDTPIDLFVYDARDSANLVVPCSGESIKNNLIRLILQTYTSPKISVLETEDAAVPGEDKVLIKIGILDYHIAASLPRPSHGDHEHAEAPDLSVKGWSAVTRYSIAIIDRSTGREKLVARQISELRNWPGTQELEEAQEYLQSTFDAANRKLLVVIEDSFVQ